ncbi:DUF6456 domain-containing protein [Lutibaculum baratangense]|uniref:DUF6456 domain-containing protein n=1 Tax=Lutibaculum baratangense AMV1 TaxID=631454 RepID=V4T838_9HYPH|nr:DUF6456 domain-containing protein [Lutibaculum baratangense]ESR22763.1 hypothetical protein N177_3900 [Lutibaculum baratangense AMV1]
MNAVDLHDEQHFVRLLAALARPGTRLLREDGLNRAEVARAGRDAPLLVVPDEIVRRAFSRGLLRGLPDGDAEVSAEGRAFLRRLAAGRADDSYRRQHLEVRQVSGRPSSAPGPDIVENESPLAWLHRRKGPNGEPMISEAQFLAGERLRADYTRAGLMPRLGVDLSLPPTPRGQAGVGNRVAEGLDHAIDARDRVDRAMRFVGHELGSLLIDVCCDLVGLEEVERRRGWPRRSGKLVLRIALDRLVEHYGIGVRATGAARAALRHWGAEGYRPAGEG